MLRTFFTTVAVGSLFVGGLAATHVAYAQPGPDGPRGPRGGMMAQADANKDGKISKAELTASLEARFARMDVDRDGQITQKDRDALRQQRQDARFAELDADKNGQISKAEFTAAHDARVEKRQERRAEAGKPGERDGRGWGRGPHRGPGRGGPGGFGPGRPGGPDKDAVMTKAQFMARPVAMFDKADANKDGFVTGDEMKAARQAMRAEWKDRKGPPPPPQN
ncbi:calcium-binding protein [Sphingobium sp. CR2-8]|uniref:EF-hand domain-containing protein n=1 Tax=Sphingobium sp. CR2-8 TaxID=1306534 RepID=UPI002DB7A740|nr:calcium-binding protein [Sphingobium sp. CR2-8]MEC3912162.1 calcium-binding protein [Sphingobium sp. CR2-8]